MMQWANITTSVAARMRLDSTAKAIAGRNTQRHGTVDLLSSLRSTSRIHSCVSRKPTFEIAGLTLKLGDFAAGNVPRRVSWDRCDA